MTPAKLTGAALHRAILKEARHLYTELLQIQNGVCAICGNPPKTRKLHIDHDHTTGAIRGLLCFQCNHYLVRKGVTKEKLVRAYHYLESPPARKLER